MRNSSRGYVISHNSHHQQLSNRIVSFTSHCWISRNLHSSFFYLIALHLPNYQTLIPLLSCVAITMPNGRAGLELPGVGEPNFERDLLRGEDNAVWESSTPSRASPESEPLLGRWHEPVQEYFSFHYRVPPPLSELDQVGEAEPLLSRLQSFAPDLYYFVLNCFRRITALFARAEGETLRNPGANANSKPFTG